MSGAPRFIHLRTHTEHSLLEGAIPVKKLVKLAAAAEMPAIAVTDTGIGMSPSEVDTALRPFGQVDSGFNKRHEGTGLGLPIAHALARMHGGDLRIDSSKGRGTRVTLLIPILREPAGEPPLH